MNVQDYFDVSEVAPFLMLNHEVSDGESNASVIAKIAWKYRVKPGHIAKYVLQNSRSMFEALSRDVAVSGNSITDKSLEVYYRLAEVAGLRGFSGSFAYLRPFLDIGARGLISYHKKWCALCYSESMARLLTIRQARVSDQLYWSLNLGTHCSKHLCSLSEVCGKCFQKQPYISSVVEPGFCHSCFASLADAPFVVPDNDEERDEIIANFHKYDVFYPHIEAPNRELSMSRLAKNLRVIIDFCGDDGVRDVSFRCGVSEHTLKDWCRARHGISFESFIGLIDGFGVTRASDLFAPSEEFCLLVKEHFCGRIAMYARQDRSSAIPGISAYLRAVIGGEAKAIPRAQMAKKFGVSVGMLEHGFKNELQEISDLYDRQKAAASLKARDRLQFEMNRAVRRCGGKNRPIDCAHIFVELQNIDLKFVKQRDLDAAKEKAVKAYLKSTRRNQERDVEALVVDE